MIVLSGCVGACKRVLSDETQRIPAGWTQRGLSPRGGSQFDMINHAEQGVRKTNVT